MRFETKEQVAAYLGDKGKGQQLRYGSQQAQQLIKQRTQRLEEGEMPNPGYSNAERRQQAIRDLADEGSIKLADDVELAATRDKPASKGHVESSAEKNNRLIHKRAKEIAELRGIDVSVVMNAFARQGKVTL
jgi:hypothetical protein